MGDVMDVADNQIKIVVQAAGSPKSVLLTAKPELKKSIAYVGY